MGQVDKNSSLVFIEHRGQHGGMARREKGCVRRHVANETLRKRRTRDDMLSPPVFCQSKTVQQDPHKVSESDDEVTEEPNREDCYETGITLDRLGILSLPLGKPGDTELVDHISARLWPGFRYNFEGSVNPFPAYWIPRSLANPALYHALIFSELCHLSSRLILAGQRPRDKRELVSLETRALVATKDQIGYHSMLASPSNIEDLIMITICLATNVQGERMLMARDPSPFCPILTSGRWLDTYGALACRNVHWNAVLQLIEKLGGIRKIKSFGLPWVVTWLVLRRFVPSITRKIDFIWLIYNSAALNVASTTLSLPTFPLLDVTGEPCQKKKYQDIVHPNIWEPACSTTGPGFEVLQCVGLSDDVVDAFTSLRDFSMILHAYATGRMANVDMDAMLDTRDVVIHTLLSLPPVHDFPVMQSRPICPTLLGRSEGSGLHLRIYQACRWAALLYGILVVFPIPRSKNAREHAVAELQNVMSSLPIRFNDQGLLRLEVWLLVIGGASTYGTEPREWFRTRLTQVVEILELQAWHEVQKILMDFAWVPNICNPATLGLWTGAD